MGRLPSKKAFLFLSVAIFLSTFSLLPIGTGLGLASPAKSLAAIGPAKIGLFAILGVIALIAVLVGAGAALVLRRHKKIVAASVLVVIVVVAGVGALWSAEASINYWLVTPYTTRTQDNALTIYCENTGHLPGTFNLVLSFTRAHFSLKTSLPYQLVNNQTVKFTFTLQPDENQSRQAWFIIDNNISDFYIYLSFEQNDGNFLVKSAPGGVDSVSYQKDVADANFTMRTFYPPP